MSDSAQNEFDFISVGAGAAGLARSTLGICAMASAGFWAGAGVSILVPHLMQNFISSEISALQLGQFIILIPLELNRYHNLLVDLAKLTIFSDNLLYIFKNIIAR